MIKQIQPIQTSDIKQIQPIQTSDNSYIQSTLYNHVTLLYSDNCFLGKQTAFLGWLPENGVFCLHHESILRNSFSNIARNRKYFSQ